jgi:hypothetical protein
LLVQTHAQNRIASIPAGGTPLIADKDVSGPVPRLPDGHPDLSGPWLGGGSNADIEHEGGLKPGELPLLGMGEGAQGQAQGAGRTVRRVPAR